MQRKPLTDALREKLTELAPAGFWLVRRARMTDRNQDILDHMPPDWSKRYREKSYALGDPVFFWCMFNAGTIRWSEINIADPRGVFKKAKDYGLNYGAVTSMVEAGRHSMLSIARGDREYTNNELKQSDQLLREALAQADASPLLTPEQIQVLQDLANGLTLEASATASGVAISTVKNRLNKARNALGTTTSVQAVAEAIKRELL